MKVKVILDSSIHNFHLHFLVFLEDCCPRTTSRNISVGIGTTVNDDDLTFGNTILQVGQTGTGTLVGYAWIYNINTFDYKQVLVILLLLVDTHLRNSTYFSNW